MKKQIKKWGESLIVSFDKEDQEVYGITAQSILDLSDMSVINKEGQAASVYLHPWELDPEHPKLADLPLRIKLPHYFNLKSTERKLKALLRDFKFGSISDQL